MCLLHMPRPFLHPYYFHTRALQVTIDPYQSPPPHNPWEFNGYIPQVTVQVTMVQINQQGQKCLLVLVTVKIMWLRLLYVQKESTL